MVGSVAFKVTVLAWVLFELSLGIRETVQRRGGTGQDRFTRVLITLSIAVALGLAVLLSSHLTSLRVPIALGWAGIAIMWIGLGLRGWAVWTLGRSFRTTVEVDPDQVVIDSGPYARIRHPSYTGLLLILTGFGLATGTAPGVAICLLLPLPAIVRRITVEEAELGRVLGEPYRRYRARTRRLVPGVW